jgi:glucokinase-like ROK family protein
MFPYNSTGDQTLVREINLSTILRHLQRNSPQSRAQLASLTGLNKSTVSSLVEELIERGLVHETGINTSGAGRPATLLEMNPRAGCIVGIELGVDFVSVILSDFVGQQLWFRMEDANPLDGPEKQVNQALKLVDEAIAYSWSSGLRLLGQGLATPGTVNTEEGILIFAPNLHWRNVPFGRLLYQHTGVKAMIDNDANAAAVGEHLFGVARQMQNFIMVFTGVGIGGGLFLNGELYRGKNGYAGEIGHSIFMAEPMQPPCHCGNRGCWETYANQFSIIERVRVRLEVRRSSLIPELMARQKSPLTIAIITQAAEAGDAEAQEALAEAGSAMGLGIANLINIFNPEAVIVGGPLSVAGKHLLPAITEMVKKRTLPEMHPETNILLSASGAKASLVGAVALVVKSILAKPTSVERLTEHAKN